MANSNWNYTDPIQTQANSSNTIKNNSASSITSNPAAALDKDAFLKLLLVELQYQDPTDPMDTDKMLTQTSQLAALEMQQNTNTTMQKMVETMEQLAASFGTSMSMAAVGAIGKMATIQDPTISLTGADEVIALKMYLPEASNEDGIALEIYDEKGKLVFSEKSSEGSVVKEGVYTLEWPGRNNDGNFAGSGKYTAKIVYNNANGEKITAEYGTYMIEGVVFKNGVAYAKMGGEEVPFNQIAQFSNYTKESKAPSGGNSGGNSSGDSQGEDKA